MNGNSNRRICLFKYILGIDTPKPITLQEENMCTAITYKTDNHYFGRNLDLEYSYHETVTITPRNYRFFFRMVPPMPTHLAMIGMAYVMDDYPLYYDATNEAGLSMAGLNFPVNAYYQPVPAEPLFIAQNTNQPSHSPTVQTPDICADNHTAHIAPFEFIPWILTKCKDVKEARVLLNRINLVNIPFSAQLPLSPLHWMISDQQESVVVESMQGGLHIHGNPIGVLTNNPPFEYQLFHLNNYRNLKTDNGQSEFSQKLSLNEYSQGLGALGLPSLSRRGVKPPA